MSTRPSRDGLKPKGDKVGVCVSGPLNVARTIIQNDALPGLEGILGNPNRV